MKESKNAKDRGDIGFPKVEDGWHIIEFQNGVDFLKDKDGNISTNDDGKKRYKFPSIVKDDSDPSNGKSTDLIVLEGDYGGGVLSSVLAAVGLLAKFDEKFPNNSIFDTPVQDAVKVKLPGKQMRIKTETSKDGKYSNWVKFGPLSASIADLDPDSSKGGTTTTAAPGATTGAPKQSGDDW